MDAATLKEAGTRCDKKSQGHVAAPGASKAREVTLWPCTGARQELDMQRTAGSQTYIPELREPWRPEPRPPAARTRSCTRCARPPPPAGPSGGPTRPHTELQLQAPGWCHLETGVLSFRERGLLGHSDAGDAGRPARLRSRPQRVLPPGAGEQLPSRDSPVSETALPAPAGIQEWVSSETPTRQRRKKQNN